MESARSQVTHDAPRQTAPGSPVAAGAGSGEVREDAAMVAPEGNERKEPDAKDSARPAKNQNDELASSRKKHSTIPQKIAPVPQNFQDDLVNESDIDNDFEDFAGNSNWRVEQRFYDKKDGSIMLYWNYRSRQPLYINGQRKIAYKPGGKKVWQQSKKKRTK